jgi:uncharacterized repeat protein (TIGR01451 family)
VTNFAGLLTKVTASVFVPHTFVSDLKLELISPNGSTVPLTVNHGSSGDNYGVSCSPESLRTTFDDDAALAISAGNPPYLGSFKPDAPLTAFAGMIGTNVNGIWKLHAVDSVALDVGVIQCWSLFLYTAGCTDGGGTCPGSDLSIGIKAAPEPVFIGSNLVYTITATNVGPSAATNTVVHQVLPASVIPVSVVASQGGGTFFGNTMIGNLGTMGIGDVVTMTVTVTPTATGAITSTANVSSDESDADTGNNAAAVVSHVSPATADLVIGVVDAPDPALLGGVVTYTISVTNRGPSVASGVTVTNTLSGGLIVQSTLASQGSVVVNGNVVSASLGTLTNGGRATITITAVTVAEGVVSLTADAKALRRTPRPCRQIRFPPIIQPSRRQLWVPPQTWVLAWWTFPTRWWSLATGHITSRSATPARAMPLG